MKYLNDHLLKTKINIFYSYVYRKRPCRDDMDVRLNLNNLRTFLNLVSGGEYEVIYDSRPRSPLTIKCPKEIIPFLPMYIDKIRSAVIEIIYEEI